MIFSEPRWRLLLVLALTGCTSAGKPSNAPHLTAVEPAEAFADEPTQLVLRGEAFTPRATTRWGGGTGDIATDVQFDVFVGDQPLAQVTWVDSTTLTAIAPAGLPLGKHAVRLVDPYGAEASLPDALEIRGRRGGVLTATLTTDASTVRVLKQLVAHLDLTNSGDATVDAIGALQLEATGTAEVVPLGVGMGKTSLAPGESTRFELTWVSRAIGTIVLSGEARGVDARTGTSVRAGPLTTAELQVLPPPDVTSTLTAAKKRVSQGQVIELMLEASNVGLVGVKDLLPAAIPTPPGLVDLKTAPLKRDLPAGAKQPFSFFFDTRATGVVSFRVDALGRDALTNAPVAMTPAFETVTIVKPAALAVTLAASAMQVGLGQRLTVTASVTNPGDAMARMVTPAIAITGAGALTLVSAPSPASVGAAPVTFVWQYDGLAKGPVQLTLSAGGLDENSGAPITSPTASVSVLVAQPASLATTFSTPLRVNVGQSFGWSIDVANGGDATALGVTPGPVTVLAASPGVPDGGPVPASHDIPGGAARTFSFGHVASVPGPLAFELSPSGTEAVNGSAIVAPVTASSPIQVERPAQLAGTLTIPAIIPATSRFNATLQVHNTGEATALAVAPSTLGITGNATLISGPLPATAQLGADAGVSFTWVLASGNPGTAQVTASATGLDSNDGRLLTTGPKTSNLATLTETEPLGADPFGDGTPFAFVVGYAGRVWLGPSRNGTGAVSMNADGSAPASHAFSFVKDTSGSRVHGNTSAAPYASLGRTGCTANTASCGPDNENGRGLFFSGSFLGSEFLGAAGARTTGNFDYFYLSTDTDPTIDFRYVDTDAIPGNNATYSVSAAHFFNDRLYVGLPDGTGPRPYLVALVVAPPAPGLNVTLGTTPDAGVTMLELQAQSFTGMGSVGGNTAPLQLIDTITDFNDALYVANNGGLIRSTNNAPRGATSFPGDWATATPSSASYTAKSSVVTAKTGDLLPADRAFPEIVTYQGRLYAARNTTSGPQLWACTPGVDLQCAPSEWTLVAPNAAGDAELTQFNATANTSIGLLAATATALYVGFNNVNGVSIYKTTVASPAVRADFTGTNGCVAGTAGCQGLGGNGLGVPGVNRQIYDGRALTFGGSTYVYVVTGNSATGVRVWRIGG